jgi:hypothetical protein
MKLLQFFILLVFCNSCKEENKEVNLDIEKETAVLKQLEHDAIQAEFKMDTASISKVMDEGFISITAKDVTTKHDELAALYQSMKKRKEANHTIDSFYLDDFKVSFFDNTAIVTFFIVTKGIIDNKPYQDKRTRFYDAWIKKGKNWKLISMQATPLNY